VVFDSLEKELEMNSLVTTSSSVDITADVEAQELPPRATERELEIEMSSLETTRRSLRSYKSSHHNATPHSQYRAEVDGLRCITVGSVFLYHLDERLLPGRFAGADVFFAISGCVVLGSFYDVESPLPPLIVFCRFMRVA
jgi:hypothetical protein